MVQNVHAPALDRGFEWLNTDRPLDFKGELLGQVVLLDFWTYCCINCMHVLPDLAYLEERYADQPLVVIGVHSNKFTNEGTRRNVRAAVLRYEIAHPVVVDESMQIWQSFGVSSWPTRVLIDPEGYVLGGIPGEGHRDELEQAIGQLIRDHRAKGTLADAPLRLRREEVVPTASRLCFPGKVLADRAGGRLFISDSNHNRIVVTSWPDDDGACTLLHVIGTGAVGFQDGAADAATFDHPQGAALDGDALYVADTENHAIRRVSLSDWSVTTVAGTGEMSNDRQGGRTRTEQGLNSPWDLAVQDGWLFIAMAGTHQLWAQQLETGATGVFAGSGREDITDGPAAQAALAQPSGLTILDDVLYFADSETSAIRGVDLRTRLVTTVLGTGLFDFGDEDGAYPHARLQHCLGVAAYNDALLVADTYNHKIKIVDPTAQTVRALTGLGSPAVRGEAGGLGLFEPGGITVADDVAFIADTNNHRIVRLGMERGCPAGTELDTGPGGYMVETGEWAEVHIAGLTRPGSAKEDGVITVPAMTVSSAGPVHLELSPALPDGAHLNPDAPVSVRVVAPDGEVLLNEMRMHGALPIEVIVRDVAPGPWRIELHCGYCTEGDRGLCVPHSVQWELPVDVSEQGATRVAVAEA